MLLHGSKIVYANKLFWLDRRGPWKKRGIGASGVEAI